MMEQPQGFVFDFDSPQESSAVANNTDCTTEYTTYAPFAAHRLADLLREHAYRALHGVATDSVALDSFPTGDTPRHFLTHVVGVRVDELQRVASEAGSSGTELRDVVPGRYLGGLKVWSCAVDLARAVFAAARPSLPVVAPPGATPTLRLHIAIRRAMAGASVRILELGCGHGLPGMAALACGALDVSFHDYNEDALQKCLLPNLCATFRGALQRVALSSRTGHESFHSEAVVRFGFGDWGSFAPADPVTMEPMLFDCILGADVTYDAVTTCSMVAAIARLLKPGGSAFLGTKVYYFGTGGGTAAIDDALSQYSSRLRAVMEVPTYSDGDAMSRCIRVIEAR